MMRRNEFSYIKRNIRDSPSHFKNLDFVQRKQENDNKIRFAKERKSDIEVHKRKMNIIWLNKWSLIREKREEMERICNNIRMIRARKDLLCKNISAFQVIKTMYEVFRQRRLAVIQQMKIDFAVTWLGIRLRHYLKRKGKFRE
jgi:hypothetical protein